MLFAFNSTKKPYSGWPWVSTGTSRPPRFSATGRLSNAPTVRVISEVIATLSVGWAPPRR